MPLFRMALCYDVRVTIKHFDFDYDVVTVFCAVGIVCGQTIYNIVYPSVNRIVECPVATHRRHHKRRLTWRCVLTLQVCVVVVHL